MTLERHRSKLIPDVQYSLDGTIFVTDREGTFPVRGKKSKHRGQVHSEADYDVDVDKQDVRSFRSYDRDRQQEKRRFKPREPSRYEQEVKSISGNTWSTGSNSMARKVRKSKALSYRVKEDDNQFDPTPKLRYGTQSDTGHDSKRKKKKGDGRIRGGTPVMSPELAATLGRKTDKHDKRNRKYNSLDIRDKHQRQRAPRPVSNPGRSMSKKSSSNSLTKADKFFGSPVINNNNGVVNFPLLKDVPTRSRKIHDERLPSVIFLVVGAMLVCLGVVRVLLSWWLEYFSSIWTGAISLLLGILGVTHHKSYLRKRRNRLYIIMAVVDTIAVVVSTGIILHVLINLLKGLADDSVKAEGLADYVTFSNWGKSLGGINLARDVMGYVSITLDVITLLVLLVNFYSAQAMLMALGNHWDAAYDTTGDCDHRGNPRFFNPLSQVLLGMATMFFALVLIVLFASDVNHYWSPMWASLLIMIAGIVSTCSGKRPDIKKLGTAAIFMQILALLACGAATLFVAMGVVKDITNLHSNKAAMSDVLYGSIVASAIAEAIFVFIMTLNIIYMVGILFRHSRQLCCLNRGGKDAGVESSYL